MDGWRPTALALGVAWLLSFPAQAAGGYDIAHIVERTCEPGGPLIVTDEFKRAQDRDLVMTEPGEVIACPPAGETGRFQLAAGPDGRYLCAYFSLPGGDGSDTCVVTESGAGASPFVQPLRAIRVDESGRLALAGIASDDIAAVALAPGAAGAADPTMVPIDSRRAAGLGASAAFTFFSLPVDGRALCAEEPARIVGRDRSGQRIAEEKVPESTGLLDGTDPVAYARSLKPLCRSLPESEPADVGWLGGVGVFLRSLLTLI